MFDVDSEPKPRSSKAPSPLPPLTLQDVQAAVYGLNMLAKPDPDRHPDEEPDPQPRSYRSPKPGSPTYQYVLVGVVILWLLIVLAIWVL